MKRRQRLEGMAESSIVNGLLEMVGNGNAHCTTAAAVARRALDDGLNLEAVQALASLGNQGDCPGNTERDMQRWVRGLWGFEVQPYKIRLKLQAPQKANLL